MNQTKQNTKPAKPVQFTPTQAREHGAQLATADGKSAAMWNAAIAGCESVALRKELRGGFVTNGLALKVYATKKAANNRFDYLCRLYAPMWTSRKAKSNAKKRTTRAPGAGRKEKTSAAVEKMSEKRLAANVVRALAYIADAQAKHSADGDMLEVLGKIASILSKAK